MCVYYVVAKIYAIEATVQVYSEKTIKWVPQRACDPVTKCTDWATYYVVKPQWNTILPVCTISFTENWDMLTQANCLAKPATVSEQSTLKFAMELAPYFNLQLYKTEINVTKHCPDSKIHVANTGPTWVLSAPDGPMLAPGTLLSECLWDLISCKIGFPSSRFRIPRPTDEDGNVWWGKPIR